MLLQGTVKASYMPNLAVYTPVAGLWPGSLPVVALPTSALCACVLFFPSTQVQEAGDRSSNSRPCYKRQQPCRMSAVPCARPHIDVQAQIWAPSFQFNMDF